ncbi:phosphoribosylglycinamide formyltransferase [Cutaneotrichosporon oleaginosum]|uniref:phosphoribosylglycinamide formyltransferase 1 n=1 Tax=Cutaneotrichosporon oleaginosum TaxID=879819 RepID=A0A0J0XTA6_9TREE|nr:phosphoribosylglycinamide formyltransferase [Cutaneotrichosporon oleaginosum]KLT44322.1 phosphoribosylglycinamide formyltransferase [Cutaneotrichosporon oleaginosum]TXT07950.1 hypothetical protein COLE_04874 [Cutaneotrichosporon oleaginosum]
MPTLQETIDPSTRTKRITVLISGSGSNLQAILDASLTDRLPNAQVTYVLSSRSNAYGLTRAANARPAVPTSVCALKTFLNRNPGATREDYDAEVARRVLESRPDVVVLAGWMHILSDSFLDILEGRKAPPAAPALPPLTGTETSPKHVAAADVIPEKELPLPPPTQHFPIPCINLHPALPGAFDGANAIPRAFEAWKNGEVKCTGVMVHRVIKEVDRGEPLIVREVEIKEGDELADVEARIHSVEHEIIVEGTKKVLEELEAEMKLEGARQAVEKVAITDDKEA